MNYLTQDWYAVLSRRAASRPGGRIFWLGLAAFILALNLYAPAPLTVLERLLASGIFLLAFGTIWRWTYRGGGEAEFGFLPAMLVVFSLMFAFAIFTQKALFMNYAFDAYLLDEAAVNEALVLSLVGLGLIIRGYYWPGRGAVAKLLPKFEMQWRDKKAVQFMSLVFMGVGLLTFVLLYQIKLSNAVQAYLSLPGDFFLLAMIALVILQLEGHLHFTLTILLWGVLVPARIFLGMAQGQLGLGMQVVTALVITYATMRRRIPWTVFVVGFAGFVVLQPVKAGLRQSLWVNNDMDAGKEVSESDKAAALIDSTERGLALVQTFEFKDVVSLATVRLGDILVFATVVARTPRDIPYWGGSGYFRLLSVPIPRILYPEKPTSMVGNLFGHQYAMIAPENYTTSINIPQVVEFYGNFGPLGVVVGCLLLGIIYRTVSDCFIHERCGLGAIVVGIYLLAHLIDIENAFVEVFGQLWIESVTVLIFHYGMRFAEAAFRVKDWQRPSLRPRVRELEPAAAAGEK